LTSNSRSPFVINANAPTFADRPLSLLLCFATGELWHRPDMGWMPEDKWNALKRGENCPLCAKVASDELVDPYGHTVGWLSVSLLRSTVTF
jgi:hypothetical protein